MHPPPPRSAPRPPPTRLAALGDLPPPGGGERSIRLGHDLLLRHESAGRNVPRRYVGKMQRVEHRPEHAALEVERGEHGALLGRGARVALHIIEREIRVLLRLR